MVVLYQSHCKPLLIVPSHKIQNGDDIWPIYLRRFINQVMKVGGIKTWKELTISVQQLIRLLFDNNSINPGLDNQVPYLPE